MDISILCITYNHEKYIRKTLDGFLMQRGNFKYEIFIHDDASTDGTTEIVREYKRKYPDKITLLLEKENQYSKGKLRFTDFCVQMTGKYFAICEGDDAWVYEEKLKKQYEWMEDHPETSMCAHNAIRVNLKENEFVPQIFDMDSGYLDDREIIRSHHGRIPTASFFLRSKYLKYLPRYLDIAPVGDDPIRFMCARFGKIYYMDKVWSVRNYMHDGSWNKAFHESTLPAPKREYYKGYLRFFAEFNKDTNRRFEKYLNAECIWMCKTLLAIAEPANINCEELKRIISEWKEQERHQLDDVFDLFWQIQVSECRDYWDNALKSVKTLTENRKAVYIYGAGEVARLKAELLMKNNIKFEGFIVTQKKEDETEYMNYPLWNIGEFLDKDKDAYLWLCMNQANREEVIPFLYSLGVKRGNCI